MILAGFLFLIIGIVFAVMAVNFDRFGKQSRSSKVTLFISLVCFVYSIMNFKNGIFG